MKHVLSTSPASAAMPTATHPISYDLLVPVRTLRRELGLTPNDLAVLTALISFAPRAKKGEPLSGKDNLTIVFPSNAALSERTNGLDERTIRRCIKRLCDVNLIVRKSSANGKRFPLRFGGAIRDAFGFDLQPLAMQYAQLVAKANEASQMRQDLHSMRAKALALRVAASHRDGLTDNQLAELAVARNLLRRTTTTLEEVERVIKGLERILATTGDDHLSSPALMHSSQPTVSRSEASQMTVRNGQIVRQIESQKKEYICSRANGALSMKTDPSTLDWIDFEHVTPYFPEPPASPEALTRTLISIGNMLRITKDNLLRALRTAGPGRMLLAFNYLLSKAEIIRKPAPYFEKLMSI